MVLLDTESITKLSFKIGFTLIYQTEERQKKLFRYIILIPHRDILKPFGEFRERLFAEGFLGAHAFPAAAPLAEVSIPFSRAELREFAVNIRKLSMENNGKIESSGTGLIRSPGALSFFGVYLELPVKESHFPLSARGKVKNALVPPVLCAALVRPDTNPVEEDSTSEKAPVLSFRAASLANLAVRPLAAGESDYSFEWIIGPPVWLPKSREE